MADWVLMVETSVVNYSDHEDVKICCCCLEEETWMSIIIVCLLKQKLCALRPVLDVTTSRGTLVPGTF